MSVLVIGASGQIGEHLLNSLQRKGYEVIGTYNQHPRPGLHPLDLRDPEAIATMVTRCKPEIIYMPAGLSNVEYCELHPDIAWDINVPGACNVVCSANRVHARMVYFSSDYVFDGTNGPYSEMDIPRPISEYGRQKMQIEHYIALHACNYLIVRTTVVYGWEGQGKNFIYRLITILREGKRVRVPHDQIGTPTYAPNLAEVVVELTTLGAVGLFHIAGPGLVSRYDLALAAARTFGLNPELIEPVSTQEFGQVAMRPLNAGLRIEKVQGLLKTRLVDYLEGLRIMAAQDASPDSVLA